MKQSDMITLGVAALVGVIAYEKFKKPATLPSAPAPSLQPSQQSVPPGVTLQPVVFDSSQIGLTQSTQDAVSPSWWSTFLNSLADTPEVL